MKKYSDDQIIHYGKKGMRWGIRNSERSNYPRAKKKIRALSDIELIEKANRKKLENEYIREVKGYSSSRGKKIIGRIGKKILDRTIDETLNYGTKKIRKKI